MKGNGKESGNLLLGERGRVAQEKSSTISSEFTIIGSTILRGDLVMCILIFEGKILNGSIETGIHVTVKPKGSVSDLNYEEINSGSGKYFTGTLVCDYKGKKAPAVIRWHKCASSTLEILGEVFQTLDHHNLFPISSDVNPFVFIDDHGGWHGMPFLTYLNSFKDNWAVCVLESPMTLFYPIINSAWSNSFSRKDTNKNVISDKGWNPLHRNIPTNNYLTTTMTDKEKNCDHHKLNNVILPRKFDSDSITGNICKNNNIVSHSSSDYYRSGEST